MNSLEFLEIKPNNKKNIIDYLIETINKTLVNDNLNENIILEEKFLLVLKLLLSFHIFLFQ